MIDRLVSVALFYSAVATGLIGMWLHDFWWMQLAFALLMLRLIWELWPEPPKPSKPRLVTKPPVAGAVLIPTFQPSLDSLEGPLPYRIVPGPHPPGYVWVTADFEPSTEPERSG